MAGAGRPLIFAVAAVMSVVHVDLQGFVLQRAACGDAQTFYTVQALTDSTRVSDEKTVTL